ncbi:AAA family ATPase [Micrococcaceae bacterium RIT802]|nr:AAA family ATPase [Micrococcaceae bacterium RIT 802]
MDGLGTREVVSPHGEGQPPPFALPGYLAVKADPELIGPDGRYFATLEQALRASIADAAQRLDAARKMPAGPGQEAWERDMEIHRLGNRLRALRRYGLDLCLGRMVGADGGDPVYVGRLGITDATGARLLIDWRSPAAEPFFGATHADPMGLASRRRYRWDHGGISDYWDEVFTPGGFKAAAALDDQSAFIASLAGSRGDRMRDVLGTIQADQDAIIRAGSEGALVVDGGPGTGKTVVALHRTAYLLYSDPRLGHQRGGVLFVGPHRPYLDYVSDVLPSLGEEGVQTATLADLVPEGAHAPAEPDPRVARLKSSVGMVEAIEPAVALYEQLPVGRTLIETPWGEVVLTARDWQEAFNAVDPGASHNEAREAIRDSLLAILGDQLDELDGDEQDGDEDDGGTGWDGAEEAFDAYGGGAATPDGAARQWLATSRGLARAVDRVWPVLEPTDVVADLWGLPAYLARCAPWLQPAEVELLHRADARAWTTADLPLLDAARRRIGDPEASARRRRRAVTAAAERQRMNEVVDQLIATDDSEMHVMSMLRGQDLRAALADDDAGSADPDLLAGPFAHVVVDEAQELTDAQWQMLLARCPSRSLTIVGDRAQARHGFTETWGERLARVGFDRIALAPLSVNYRTPREIMEVAEREIHGAIPDANVPTSIRSTGLPVRRGTASEAAGVLTDWLEKAADGSACVIPAAGKAPAGIPADPRIRSLTPELVKGLEFDLVVLVDPADFGTGVEGYVDRYVAMTRATRELVVLTGS